MAEAVFSVQPDRQTSIPPFFSVEEEPVAFVKAWAVRREQRLDSMYDHLGLFPMPSEEASSSTSQFSNPWILPLRSEGHVGKAGAHAGKRKPDA